MELRLDDNLLDYRNWIEGGIGSTGIYTEFTTNCINERIVTINPFNNNDTVWKTYNNGTTGATSGGYYVYANSTNNIIYDDTKTYRYSIWVKRKVAGTTGSLYFGSLISNSGNTNIQVKTLTSGLASSGRYFCYIANSNMDTYFPIDEWKLMVAHMFPFAWTGTTNHDNSGVWKLDGTKLSLTGGYGDAAPYTNDGVWNGERIFAPYQDNVTISTSGMSFELIYPRMDVVDGTEPSVAELLSGLTYKLNSGGTYYDVGAVKIKQNDTWYDVKNIKLKKDNNLLDYSDWSTDYSGSTTYFVGYTASVGIVTRILDTDPFNNNMYLWQDSATSSGSTAGWQTISIPIDHTKKYRFSVWMKRIGGTIGRYYFGFYTRDSSDSAIDSKRVSDELLSNNFYFISNTNFTTITTNDFPENEWRLLVGYVLDSSYSEGYIDKWKPKMYDIYGNVKVNSAVNYMFLTGTTYVKHRIYAPYTGDSTYKMAYPRIDVVDGTEPSITTLLTSEGVWLDAKTFNKNEEF